MKTKGSFQNSIILISVMMISGFTFLAKQGFAQEASKGKPTKPDVRIKVNKEFDDKGNVTRYDSTYYYSWSGNGFVPANIDSVFKGFDHNLKYGELDSMFNNFGFGGPFDEKDMFSQPFANHSKQFEQFFRNHQFPADSLFEGFNNESFHRDFKEMLKQQQRLMEQFYNQFKLNRDSLTIDPNDSIPLKEIPKGKIKPEKQNYFPNSKTSKTISV